MTAWKVHEGACHLELSGLTSPHETCGGCHLTAGQHRNWKHRAKTWPETVATVADDALMLRQWRVEDEQKAAVDRPFCVGDFVWWDTDDRAYAGTVTAYTLGYEIALRCGTRKRNVPHHELRPRKFVQPPDIPDDIRATIIDMIDHITQGSTSALFGRLHDVRKWVER